MFLHGVVNCLLESLLVRKNPLQWLSVNHNFDWNVAHYCHAGE